MLGIQKDSVPKLIAAGLLRTYRKSSSRYELLSHDEVKHLMDECRGKVVTTKEMVGMRLHDALITYSVNGLSIVKIIQFTQEGELNPLTNNVGGNITQNFYRIDELEKCIEILKKEQQDIFGYYLKDVLKILNIGEKKAWKWIAAGILVPDQISTLKDGRKRYLFKKKTIDTLQKQANLSRLQNSFLSKLYTKETII